MTVKSEAIRELEALRADLRDLLSSPRNADYCIGALVEIIRTLIWHIQELEQGKEDIDDGSDL